MLLVIMGTIYALHYAPNTVSKNQCSNENEVQVTDNAEDSLEIIYDLAELFSN